MKYDFSKKLTIGAARTLHSLQQAMRALLSSKAFEEVTVGELCEKAMLPRATFYNYFDDKYDLLQYCLMTVRDQLDSGYRDMDNCSERMNCLMENCFDYLDQNIDTVQKILRNNPANQYLINQVRLYLLSNMSAAFQSNPNSHQFKVPREMAAKLYSEAIVIILEWKYLEKRECSKEQAKEYLRQMVSGIDEKQTVSNL
ncbi:MAG: TetR/AcrR family transcriptional regulator [Emergencia timonensis]|uniref:TetR/AcrR family transcriptional regulator n=1 Tax=Emergencia timonensis TaxID=1776384 RepID=UPI000829E29C|nr:TetR family transcriptional regulator [Emergencia timonensis]WNX87160.1 TetR family transcriptional regulator [Emergencia timonensis]